MNFKNINTVIAQKLRPSIQIALVLFFVSGINGCKQKSELNDIQGDVQVKIPVSSQSGDSAKYELSTVTLKGLSNLKEVTGFFARFFFAPGLNQNQLVGDSPQARFVKTKGGIYIPVDSISQQMATLYYHIQNLSEFSRNIGIGHNHQKPMKIGIETRISDSDVLDKNNAFYDGKSDAMLFVPFTSNELPIAVNSGIIAHEYFHSLFYKIVFNQSENQKTEVTTHKLQSLYNETYLRGINEGLADFWGWAYTNDVEFMSWSLSSYSKDRQLNLSAQNVGVFQRTEDIKKEVQTQIAAEADPSKKLTSYIYKIGTPNARFLKQMTSMMMTDELSPLDAKIKMAKTVISFVQLLAIKAKEIPATDFLPADSLFDFVASEIKLSEAQCKFILSYIHKNELRKTDQCEKQTDDSYLIKAVAEVVENP